LLLSLALPSLSLASGTGIPFFHSFGSSYTLL
jgi:hypothetical protein